MQSMLEVAVKPVLILKVDGAERTVEYPLTALAAAEKSLGKSLKSILDWFDLDWADVPTVLHAGLAKHHPDIPVEDMRALCDTLGAEGTLEIRHALICLNFPKAMERYSARLAQVQASPNGASAGGN